MSDSPDDGEEINRREVAWRVFAAEFDDADHSYAESDEERAPNYVITPSGARVNRMFVVGVLTEVEHVSDDVLRARVVDPTGAFVIYAGQYQPDALAFLEDAATPSFVAVTGKARTFQPEDSDVIYTSIRPESISEVGVDTRDAWVVQTAEQTLRRVATADAAIDRIERGDDLADALEAGGAPADLADGIAIALDHYGTTQSYLAALGDLAVDAARVVAEQKEEADPFAVSPSDDGEASVDVPETFVAGELGEDGATPASTTPSADSGGTTAPASTAEPADVGATEPDVAEGEAAEPDVPEGEATEAEPAADEATAPETETATADAETTAAEAASGDGDAETVDTEAGEPDLEDEPATADASSAETTTADTAAGESEAPDDTADVESEVADDTAAGESEATDDAPETDEMYELSEEERREVEENYDVGFSSGNEVPEAGEVDIEPEAGAAESEGAGGDATTADGAAEPATSADADDSAASTDTEDDSAASTDSEDEPADAATGETADLDEADLENAVLTVMEELDDGDGAAREDLVSEVVAEYGASEDAVEDAIQSALMGGRCYESGDDRIKPI